MEDIDPTDTDALAKAAKARDMRNRNAQDTEAADIAWMMSSKRGRRILWRQLERAGVYRSSFNTNSMAMAFAEGERNAGLRLLASIHEAAPDQFTTMLKESREQ